ncbi:MAG: hypothetical protein HYS12_08350 [Planctomycetes bacterium]|nr:hypothetical protein [Planctomycetota bacterium]
MRLLASSRSCGQKRPGKTLVLFVLLAPILLGMTGLVLDAGLMMAAQRQAQNAADAAALAAAFDKFRGNSDSTALATANTFLTNNGLSGITLTLNAGATNALNIPPQDPGSTGSPYAGVANYVEVVVTKPVTTLFIQALGINSSQQVTARAVAGYEPVGAGEGVFVLDPTARPGLQVNSNNTRLVVNGDITVNSQGGGYDQFGVLISNATSAVKNGTSLTTPAPIVASTLNVVGGVDSVDNVRAYDAAFSGNGYYYDTSNPDRPLIARVPIAPDPLTNSNYTLPTPTTSSTGTAVVNTDYGSVSVGNNETVTLNPGIYRQITITGGTVTFNPGIYVLSPSGTTPNIFNITGGTVTGNGVMFYNTGSDYTATTGAPDSSDGSATPNAPNTTKFGAFQINGGTVSFVPLTDSNSPFNGFLFYQRRWNTTTAAISGNSNSLNLQGTLYAKWARFQVSGQGTYQAQFLVGSMTIDGGATVTINAAGKNIGKANLVFLVE